MEQNIPNPFHENTTIKYYLPSDSRTANITITDLSGVQMKQFDLSGGKGFGQVLISGGAFAAGTYIPLKNLPHADVRPHVRHFVFGAEAAPTVGLVEWYGRNARL